MTGAALSGGAVPRLIVVSPHLDDAVLGCSGLLVQCPGSVVCTVFAGEPDAPMSTPWDAACGFADSREAMRVRREEDDRALSLCGAQALRLDFRDAQYGATPSVDDVAEALAAQFARFPGYVPVCPLGLWHSDHELVGAASRRLLASGRLARCIAYEDAIYRAMPGVLSAGFKRLEHERLRAHALRADAFGPRAANGFTALKRRAVQAYASQMRAFETIPPDAVRAEHYWRIAPR